ncbi:unnamed protein product [Prorocentrum cordatum]|uniref:Calx-beta domain-containing protein n=2 Tax=Prorocentrum cordatum TaxID=2364126 RepID=A0ABN9XWM4_9DINO|nr:unnamed protein product [Polarella glacialis]
MVGRIDDISIFPSSYLVCVCCRRRHLAQKQEEIELQAGPHQGLHSEKAQMVMEIRRKYGEGENVSDFIQDYDDLIHYEFDPRPSRAQRRMQATRDMFGGKPLPFAAVKTQESVGAAVPGVKALVQIAHNQTVPWDDPVPCCVEHRCIFYMVHESDRKVDCVITRTGDLSRPCRVHVKTVDGTAKAGSDYVAIDSDITFDRHEASKTVSIVIVEDTEYEETENFQLHLSVPPDSRSAVGLARERGDAPGADVASILIFDNNHPGVFGFKDYDISVRESCDATTPLAVEVHRSSGSYGKVSCRYRTEDMTATEKIDYEPISGTLEFDHGEAVKTLKLQILPKIHRDKTEQFRLIISDATGKAKFDDSVDGSSTSCICTITIQRDQEARTWLGRLADLQPLNADHFALGKVSWREQFLELRMGDEPAGFVDHALHLALFPWKLMCACVPPPIFCGGWVCFAAALVVIGVLTAVIGDLAEMLGCALLPMLPPQSARSITAVTIVALGTSLPDTFASMKSASQDRLIPPPTQASATSRAATPSMCSWGSGSLG